MRDTKLAVRRALRVIALLLLLAVAAIIVYNSRKPLPAGLSFEGPIHRVTSVDFLYDLSYKKPEGQPEVREQAILNRILQAVDEADKFIVIDMFLFNSYVNEGQSFPKISGLLTDKLIERKTKNPELQAIFITDEVNTSYGSHASPELERLKAAGVQTVVTDTDALRDSTPLYSGVWRIFFRPFGTGGQGWIKNPMADTAPDMTVRSYAKLFNVKANHRKVIATEDIAIVSSGNVHDASADHSNAAFAVSGPIIADVLASEQAAAKLGGGASFPSYKPQAAGTGGDLSVRLLTEGKVNEHLLRLLSEAGSGNTVWMGMFYLADPDVIQALREASDRGADIRLILDPNQNAFGNDKIGLPNRPVAEDLVDGSEGRIQVRWYNTGEEQYHTKMMMVTGRGAMSILGGSTNFTTRNLDDYNLETDLLISGPADSEVARKVEAYWDRLWSNRDGAYTLDYEAYKETTYPLKKLVYQLQGWLGFTTF
ncbi:phospholipase D family protein [Paenibacillus mucilaginosus]|nr:phospholipase D family protein [Paenibacillus caseinilyticus]MCZ8523208.1 phospholipase D family protein [Paenibacillus caseinilyticus]